MTTQGQLVAVLRYYQTIAATDDSSSVAGKDSAKKTKDETTVRSFASLI